MYKLINLIICHQESFKNMCVQFSMTNHKAKTSAKNMSSNLTVEFLLHFIEDLNYPKPTTLGEQNFASLKRTVSHPWQVATIPQKRSPRKPSSFRCGAVSGEQITLSPKKGGQTSLGFPNEFMKSICNLRPFPGIS